MTNSPETLHRLAGPESVPFFFLYGEAPRQVEARFLHLESLDERNRPANWNIQPHAHAELHHIFHFAAGRGVMASDGTALEFTAPALLLVPAGVAHGFACEPDTRGSVMTIADEFLEELFNRGPDLRDLFARSRALPLTDGDAVEAQLARLQRELAWTAPGHEAVVESLLVLLLVDSLRLSRAARAAPQLSQGPHAALLARFRGRVEASYRQDLRIEDYADALKVPSKRLRAACAQFAGCTPLDIIQDRRLLEAKRLLLYSNLNIAEMAYYLGFSDPAYFSRFFAQRSGRSPRAFRTSQGRSAADQ